jgi:hypothetical protein
MCWSLDAPHESWRACQINNITPSEEENIFNHGRMPWGILPLSWVVVHDQSEGESLFSETRWQPEWVGGFLCNIVWGLRDNLHCQGPEAEWGWQCLGCPRSLWQKLHSHAYTCAMVCSFVSFTYYLISLRRQIAKKIRLWRCLFCIIRFPLTVDNSDMN